MRRPIPLWSTAREPAGFDRAAYSEWLKSLRQVCSERDIVLIFDEGLCRLQASPQAALRNISACAPTW
jgi:glutamate-1-semialdehyde aminotransferase